jgi:hypothetical protein
LSSRLGAVAKTSVNFQNQQDLNSPVDQAEFNNWKTIAERMEASGDTESWFYLRARAIADGKQDPMPNVSELMSESV